MSSRRSAALDKSLARPSQDFPDPEDLMVAQEQTERLEKRLSPKSPRQSLRPTQRRLSRLSADKEASFPLRTPPNRAELPSARMNSTPEETGNVLIENELLRLGYTPVSWIGIANQNKRYLKSVNRRGQTVFVMIEGEPGVVLSDDLTFIESDSGMSIPSNYVNAATQCTSEVCGVAFECGDNALCTLVRSENALEPEETNFVLVESSAAAGNIVAAAESTEGVLSYPVVRLAEIRANAPLVLENTDRVMRRLRNSSYAAQLQELGYLQQSIVTLGKKFNQFNLMRERVAKDLNQALTELEKIAKTMDRPCESPHEEREFTSIQAQLLHRNQWIGSLVNRMKMVADKRMEIDRIAEEIHNITLASNQDFANILVIDYPTGYNA